ncbi:MAG: hypothetical protein ACPGVD_08690 [Flavobacteriales bacterium]
MKSEKTLSRFEEELLKKVDLEISLDFLHLIKLNKSILLKDIREIKIKRPSYTLKEKVLNYFKHILSDNKSGIGEDFNGTRPDTIKTISICLFNDEIIQYYVKNIDLISTSKLFKKLINANYLNNTSIE